MTRPARRSPFDPIAAQEISFDLTQADCRGQWDLWGWAEAAHQSATTEEERLEAAEPALSLCHGCPEVTGCHLRAEYDHYTGLAAGLAWVNGVAYMPGKVHHVAPLKSPDEPSGSVQSTSTGFLDHGHLEETG